MSQGGDSGSAVLDDRNHLVGLLFAAVLRHPWTTRVPGPHQETAASIGTAFLGPYILPFEVAGLLLLAALIAAVVIARKEVRDEPTTNTGVVAETTR